MAVTTSGTTPAPGSDLLDAAARAAREAQEGPAGGWGVLAETVMDRVRDLVVPGQPLLTHGDGGTAERDPQGSRTWVSSRVLLPVLRRALQQPSHAPARVDLRIRSGRLESVAVELVVTYGVDVHAVADGVRATVADTVRTLLGPDPDHGPPLVDVEVVDVVDGDPVTG